MVFANARRHGTPRPGKERRASQLAGVEALKPYKGRADRLAV